MAYSGSKIWCHLAGSTNVERDVIAFTTCGKAIVKINDRKYVVPTGDHGQAVRLANSGYKEQQ